MKKLAVAALILFAFPGFSQTPRCTRTAQVTVTAGATTEILAAGVGGIHLCGWSVSLSATGTAQWKQGTGTNCGTNTAALTPAMNLATGVPWNNPPVGDSYPLQAGRATALCLTAATGNATGIISYSIF